MRTVELVGEPIIVGVALDGGARAPVVHGHHLRCSFSMGAFYMGGVWPGGVVPVLGLKANTPEELACYSWTVTHDHRLGPTPPVRPDIWLIAGPDRLPHGSPCSHGSTHAVCTLRGRVLGTVRRTHAYPVCHYEERSDAPIPWTWGTAFVATRLPCFARNDSFAGLVVHQE